MNIQIKIKEEKDENFKENPRETETEYFHSAQQTVQKSVSLEPDISTFFKYQEKDYSFKFSSQTSAVINLNYEAISNMKAENRLIEELSQLSKKSQMKNPLMLEKKVFKKNQWGISYNYHESTVSGISYEVPFSYFKSN